MDKQKFSLYNRLKSFKHAFNGLKLLFREEHNSRVHLFAVFIACGLGFLLNIEFLDWAVIIVMISIVFITEIINTSIENMADFVSPQYDARIKTIKDLAAAAVLVASIAAVVAGGMIFLPKLLKLF